VRFNTDDKFMWKRFQLGDQNAQSHLLDCSHFRTESWFSNRSICRRSESIERCPTQRVQTVQWLYHFVHFFHFDITSVREYCPCSLRRVKYTRNCNQWSPFLTKSSLFVHPLKRKSFSFCFRDARTSINKI